MDRLMREKYGSAKQGQRTDLSGSLGEPVWTIDRTAELLGESPGKVCQDLQLARAEVLALYKRYSLPCVVDYH